MTKIQLVSPRRSLAWLGAGWYAFTSNLGSALTLSIAFLLTVMLLGLLPFAGVVSILLCLPFLFTGLLVAAHKSLTGSLALVEDILFGFNEAHLRWPLLQLGLLMVAGTLLIFATLHPLPLEILKAIYMPQTQTQVAIILDAMSQSPSAQLLLQFGVMLLITMSFFYATPLVVFEDLTPLDALGVSLHACLKNILPLGLLLCMIFSLSLLASFTFGLGFLILIPVFSGATYASFRDIFDPMEESAVV